MLQIFPTSAFHSLALAEMTAGGLRSSSVTGVFMMGCSQSSLQVNLKSSLTAKSATFIRGMPVSHEVETYLYKISDSMTWAASGTSSLYIDIFDDECIFS
mgnify:CR=1 FL=1